MHLKVSMSGLRHKTDMADEQVSNLADRLGEIFQNYKRQSREIKKKKKRETERINPEVPSSVKWEFQKRRRERKEWREE